jgi:class 3 adenylate cyclase
VADRLLDAAREALDQAGFAAFIADRDGVVVGVTDDLLLIFGAGVERAAVPLGSHSFSREWVSFQERAPGGATLASQRETFRALSSALAADVGGVDSLRAVVDPRLHDLLEDVAPTAAKGFWSGRVEVNFGDRTTPIDLLTFRLRRETGEPAGWVTITKPGISAAVLAMLATGDAQLMERMLRILQPARRPAALLFADLESSSSLSRRLSSRDYFALIRRLAVRADRSVVRSGGIVGKHVGDGITAFFLAETYGSESGAALACIEAARQMRQDALDAAARSELRPEAMSLRIGLHWGSTVYIGRLLTTGRTEITALGDEVNEAARIEACATEGRTLASKQLLERLDETDAEALALAVDHLQYTPLSELPHVPDKARRDAPTIAVANL